MEPEDGHTKSTEISSGASGGGSRMILTMGGIGLISSILLVATFVITKPFIAANEEAYLEASIQEVLPNAVKRNAWRIQGEDVVADDGATTDGIRIFAGFTADGKLEGLAVEAQGQGYQDVVRLIYGFSPDCRCIIGLKILDSRETPGLGDKIGKDPAFLSNFDSLDVRLTDASVRPSAPLALVKKGLATGPGQIEAISGATISSTAVTDILNASNSVVLPVILSHLDAFIPPK